MMCVQNAVSLDSFTELVVIDSKSIDDRQAEDDRR